MRKMFRLSDKGALKEIKKLVSLKVRVREGPFIIPYYRVGD
jgi:hypothetical protein